MVFTSTQSLKKVIQNFSINGTLLGAERLEGGVSADASLLRVQETDGDIQKYVLRAHSANNRSRNPIIAIHEFNLLKILHEGGLPVAQPRYLDASGEIFPTPYIVLDYIEGATDFSPSDIQDYIQQSAELLAKIHQFSCESPGLDFLSRRNEHVIWWINYQPEQFDHELGEKQLRDTLKTLFPLQEVNHQTLLHGDFWAGNLIWEDGKLCAVIDWEDAEIGDPLSDLSITRLEMLWAFGKKAMQDFTDTYRKVMPHLNYVNLPNWDLFSALRPAGQLEEWAITWEQCGRLDVNLNTMQQAHQWFVKQALEKISKVT